MNNSGLIIGMLFLPVILLFAFYWKRSYNEIEKGSQAYYEQIVTSFMSDFNEKLTELAKHASKISAETKNSKSAFWNGVEKFKEHNYWYYAAVNEMKDQHAGSGYYECSVYYYDVDKVITQTGTSSSEQYILDNFDIKEEHPISSFFEEAYFQDNVWVFGTSNSATNYGGYMLLGYCTTFGKNRDKVLVFYKLRQEDYEETLSTVYGNSGIHFYICDKDNSEILLALGDEPIDLNMLKEDPNRTTLGVNQQIFYSTTNDQLPLLFSLYITEDSFQNNIIVFYHETKNLFFGMVLALICVCSFVLFIAYKPVYKLMEELSIEDETADEFGRIRNALIERNTKITEQEMMILDLLLKHLIYGVPISQKRLNCLGISTNVKNYCVLVLDGYVLLASEISQITQEVEEAFHMRMFCTDWKEEGKSIFILFMETDFSGSVENELNEWLQNHIEQDCSLICGSVVNKLDDIRTSFMTCLEKTKEAETPIVDDVVKTLNPKKEQQKALKKEILQYLEMHYLDSDLGLIKVADEFRISNYTLSRMFKNQIGVGFTDYVNAKRLEYAKELLLTTTYSVKEVAMKAGFSSETYFYKMFKANVGMSPANFREQ